MTPDELAELLGFPPGWRSRVALQLEAPPAREAVTRAFYADLRKRADELGKKKYRVDAPRGKMVGPQGICAPTNDGRKPEQNFYRGILRRWRKRWRAGGCDR